MRVGITLLGRPGITVDGERRALAGHKPWALLARVVLGPPVDRRELARLLFGETADPMAACRWTILQVRRAVGPAADLVEDAGDLRLAATAGSVVEVDVAALHEGTLSVEQLEATGDVLLAALQLRGCPEIEEWLALERARASSALGASLRWAAAVTATTDPRAATRLLERTLALDPYDDVAHESLVRLLAAGGRVAAARDHVAEAERLYRQELGVDLPASVRRGLDAAPTTRDDPTTAADVDVLIELATTRAAAGDYPGAIEASRRAVSASGKGRPEVAARALLTWGSVLVHSIRGRDDEAMGLLERALGAAVTAGDEPAAAEAEREIAWVHFLRAEYGAAEGVLRRAMARSARIGDDLGRARAQVVLGACRSDRSEYAAATADLSKAIETLHACHDPWEAFALAFLGRVRLLLGHPAEARELAERAVLRCRETGWLSLAPWPMVVAGEAALRLDPDAEASAHFDHAHALARELDDPCWEAFSLRGKGLVALSAGREDDARRLMEAALERARSLPDVYAWATAVVLTDLVELEHGREPRHLAAALALTGRGPMPALRDRLLAVGSSSPTVLPTPSS